MTDQMGEALELVLAHELHDEEAVGGLEGVEHERLVVEQVLDAERPEVHHDVGHRRGGVEHRDVDVLADPALVAVTQRGEDARSPRTAPS